MQCTIERPRTVFYPTLTPAVARDIRIVAKDGSLLPARMESAHDVLDLRVRQGCRVQVEALLW